jgi:hypothetical protein
MVSRYNTSLFEISRFFIEIENQRKNRHQLFKGGLQWETWKSAL